MLDRDIIGPGKADILLESEELDGGVLTQPRFGRAILATVVHHDDSTRRMTLRGDGCQTPLEETSAVPVDDDNCHGADPVPWPTPWGMFTDRI